MRGTARFTYAGGAWIALNVGKVLRPGVIVETGDRSSVDLFMDQNGPVVRITQNSILHIEKLNFTTDGEDTIVETVLEVLQGQILGNFKEPKNGSVFLIKTPQGFCKTRKAQFPQGAFGSEVMIKGAVHYGGGPSVNAFGSGQSFDAMRRAVSPASPTFLARLRIG